jgi:DNA-binding NarL/FixJ family response regulator
LNSEAVAQQLDQIEHRALWIVELSAQYRQILSAHEHIGVAVAKDLTSSPAGRTARKRNPSTALQLTPQEIQVARFVARGLHTREVAAQLFLSTRTVDFHLRNVFAKLGISSRTELAHLHLD